MSIIDAIYTRAAAIAGLKTTKKGKRQFQESELPGLCVYRDQAVVEEAAYGGAGYRINQQVVIEYHKEVGTDADADADFEAMVAEVRAAVELPADSMLSGQLCEPLELAGVEAPELPDDAGGLVAAQVLYGAKYTSHYGGP